MASKNITFELIQASYRRPGQYLEWNTKLAMRNLPTNRNRVVLIGQYLDAALDDGTLWNVYSEDDVASRCGAGSLSHIMAKAAMEAFPYAALSMISVPDDPAAIAATATITVAGTATAGGILSIKVANFKLINVGIDKTDTVTNIAQNVVDQINVQTHLPITATSAEGVVTLTAKNKGAAGNEIKISVTNTASGITTTASKMAGGQLNPDVSDALANIAGEGHDIIALAVNDEANILLLRAHLDMLAHPTEKRWALGMVGHTGTLAQATTLAGKTNNGFISIPWYKDSPSMPCELASAYAVVVSSEEDPARPLNTLRLDGIGVCPVASKTMRVEQENALYNGVTPIETSPDGTRAQIVRAITTYTQSANGTADESLLDITTVRILIYVSKAVIQRIALRFPRNKLNDRTPDLVRSELIDVLIKCEELEILEAVVENLPKVLVERDLQNVSMLNARIPADVVNGLHIFAGVVDLYL